MILMHSEFKSSGARVDRIGDEVAAVATVVVDRQATSSPAVADVHDVAVLDDVVLALQVELGRLFQVNFSGVTGTAFGPGGQQFVALHHLGAYETPCQIAMDRVGSI
jgi:hypothetical protein